MAKQLKFGNGEWYGADGSILAYNDLNDNYKPLPFSFERGGSATRVNKQGLIEVVGGNQPRVDYKDSEDGVFLLENASTNLIPYSEDFSNAAWSKFNITVEANSTISPDGTLNASKVLEQVNSANGHFIFDDLGLTPSVEYNFSVFVKKLNRRYVALQNSYNTANGSIAFFDLDTETLIYTYSNGTVGTFIVSDAKIEKYPNGWYRLSANFQSSAATSVLPSIVLADTKWSTGFSYNNLYTGDITKGIYIWGAQIEQGSYLTSYIPTQGSIQTRVAETANGSGNSEVFNDSEGVLFVDIAANANDGLSRNITISDGTSSNRVFLKFSSTSNLLEATVVSAGVVAMQETYSISDATVYSKLILKYKQNDFSFWVNGFEVGTDSSGNAPSGLNVLDLDSGIAVNDFYGKTKEIAYYDEILTDLELETLTSYRTWEAMVKELNLNVIYNG